MTRIQISDDLFWGYNMELDIYNMANEDIIAIVTIQLKDDLTRLNLLDLVTKVDKRHWHIHDDNRNVPTVYICSHN